MLSICFDYFVIFISFLFDRVVFSNFELLLLFDLRIHQTLKVYLAAVTSMVLLKITNLLNIILEQFYND